MRKYNGRAAIWNCSVPVKTILIMLLTLVLLTTLCVVMIVRNYVWQLNFEMQGLYHNSAEAYVSAVTDRLSSYVTAMKVVGLNQAIRKNIFRTDVTRSEMVNIGQELGKSIDEMTFFLYRNTEVQSHYLYTYLPADGRYFVNIEEAQAQQWHAKLQKESFCWSYAYSSVTRSNHLTLASIVNAFGAETAELPENCYQTITIDTACLFGPSFSAYPDLKAEVFAFDNKSGVVIYGTNPGLQSGALTLLDSQAEGGVSGRVSIPGKNGEVFSPVLLPLEFLDASILLLFPTTSLMRRGDSSNLLLIIMACVVFLVCLLAFIFFYCMFARRLEELIFRMDKFDERELTPQEAIGGYDEIARIDRHLIKMQNRIRTLIKEEYAAKLQKMKAQHEALIACINPHFLYNTLNSISATACMEGADNTVAMIGALSDMFRYSSNVSGKEVALREELQNISHYLYIQGIRYQNTFTYNVDVDPQLLGCPVPKLILQPIVENAFKHGFRELSGKEKELQVSARGCGESMIISVCDNGAGISPGRLEKLLNRLEAPDNGMEAGDSAGNGLKNVHRRVRLLHGDKCGLSIRSREGEYTCVEIKIAMRRIENPPAPPSVEQPS